MSEQTFHTRLKPSGVHAGLLDDEALIVNFATGIYYTISGTGAAIVGALTRGPIDRRLVFMALVTAYPDVPSQQIEAEVWNFLEWLRLEGLTENYVYVGPEIEIKPRGAYGFQMPEVRKDLANILTLDPIHDVASEGWPKAQ